ncbi:uncharacterized protein LOC129758072 isoform X2 [Uranotaenia lowii]|uniref:uncharacterized protein LOC129758072 isoform X2 n=1 Tax=Uranotaenia lowii TaxID=190385 RepID=UPI00247AC8E1|nr:uncharacterized protein LOC129758072 isoform X2 [Uranotaenia lowii]
MVLIKVSFLVLLVGVLAVFGQNEENHVDSAEQDLEPAETIFLAKKILLLKGLGGLFLLAPKGGSQGGFPGLGGGLGGLKEKFSGLHNLGGGFLPSPGPGPVPVQAVAAAPQVGVAVAVPPPQPTEYSGNLHVMGYLTPVQLSAAPVATPLAYGAHPAEEGYHLPVPSPVPATP